MKKTAYRGNPKQFLAPVRARNVIGGYAPGVAGTRERSKVAKNASIPGNFKSPGINGVNWCNTSSCSYHDNAAGMGGKKK